MPHNHSTQKQSFSCMLLLLLAGALAGCGGGGSNNSGGSGGTTGQTLTGDMAAQAALVSGYQAFQGGVNYPFAQVEASLPNGSPFKSAVKTAIVAALQKRAAALHAATAHSGSSPDGIGLYTNLTLSGPTATLSDYTDAAETQLAGTLTLTQTAPVVSTITPGTYNTYPVAFSITANVTTGPLPVSGSGTITLLDSAGMGTIQGTFNLPASGVSTSANLTLSDSGTVGGTATVTENGQTLTLTNLSGPLTGTITGDVAVAPSGDTGTATLSIVNGTFQVRLNTPTGTATAANDSSGNLDITLPSGTTETISSPLTASPTAPIQTTTTTGGGTTTTPTYGVPVALGIPYPNGVNSSNVIIGETGSGTTLFQNGPNGTAQNLPTYQGSEEFPEGINATGEIIGFGFNQAANVFFASPTATPVSIGNGIPFGINDSGAFVGYSGAGALYWSGPTATPTTLALLSGDTGGNAYAINNGGLIVGTSASASATHPVYWTSAGAQPKPLANISGNPDYSLFGVNANGQIFATAQYSNTPVSVFWQSVTAQPLTLPALPGSGQTGYVAGAAAIGADGTVVGSSPTSTGAQHAVIWKNGQIQDLNSLIPTGSGWVLTAATAINTAGDIVGQGTDNGQSSGFFLTPG